MFPLISMAGGRHFDIELFYQSLLFASYKVNLKRILQPLIFYLSKVGDAGKDPMILED
jgi:hypothetical protein